jgi:hypothetical protein
MRTNLTGLLNNASTALRALSKLPKDASPEQIDTHEERLYDYQPRMHAFALTELRRALEHLHANKNKPIAIEQFFSSYLAGEE